MIDKEDKLNKEEKFVRRTLQVFLCIAELILLWRLAKAYSPELVLSIGIISVMLLITLVIEKVKSLSIGKEGLTAKIEVLQKKLKNNEKELYKLISLSMGEDTYFNLKKLASGKFGIYEKPHYQGLETELYYLRNLGYVRLIEGSANSIYEIPEKESDLSKYIEITDAGRRYINLRESIAEE